MSRGDSRLSSNSFSKTAHPLQGKIQGKREGGTKRFLPEHGSATPSFLHSASGHGPLL